MEVSWVSHNIEEHWVQHQWSFEVRSWVHCRDRSNVIVAVLTMMTRSPRILQKIRRSVRRTHGADQTSAHCCLFSQICMYGYRLNYSLVCACLSHAHDSTWKYVYPCLFSQLCVYGHRRNYSLVCARLSHAHDSTQERLLLPTARTT